MGENANKPKKSIMLANTNLRWEYVRCINIVRARELILPTATTKFIVMIESWKKIIEVREPNITTAFKLAKAYSLRDW